MEVKGDIRSRRTIIADRRLDQGMSTPSALTGNLALVRNDYAWLNLDGGVADRQVELPDATTLPLGWTIVIRNSGATADLNIRAYDGSFTGAIQKTIIAPISPNDTTTYEFTCVDIGSAAGSWYVTELGESSNTAASRSVVSFLSSDFPAAVSGYRTLTGSQVSGLLAANHKRGSQPTILVQELSGSDYIKVLVDQEKSLANGDIELRVVDGAEFTGRIILV